MGLFDDIKYSEEDIKDIETEKDTIGASFSKIENTGEYTVVIKKAWADKSDSGAFNINFEAETEDKQTISYKGWVTSGTAKGCKNYYLDKNGNKKYLPDYSKVKAMDYLITGLDRTFPKTVLMSMEIYDFDLKTMVTKDKEVIKEWIGKPITILVKAVREFGSKEVEGKWVTDESKVYEKVEIQHFIDPVTRRTRNEVIANENGFVDKWHKANPSDSVKDKTKGKGSVKQAKPANESTASDDEFLF